MQSAAVQQPRLSRRKSKAREEAATAAAAQAAAAAAAAAGTALQVFAPPQDIAMQDLCDVYLLWNYCLRPIHTFMSTSGFLRQI